MKHVEILDKLQESEQSFDDGIENRDPCRFESTQSDTAKVGSIRRHINYCEFRTSAHPNTALHDNHGERSHGDIVFNEVNTNDSGKNLPKSEATEKTMDENEDDHYNEKWNIVNDSEVQEFDMNGLHNDDEEQYDSAENDSENENENTGIETGPMAGVTQLFNNSIERIQESREEMQGVIQAHLGQPIMNDFFSTKNDMCKVYVENEKIQREILRRKKILLKLSNFCSDSAAGGIRE